MCKKMVGRKQKSTKRGELKKKMPPGNQRIKVQAHFIHQVVMGGEGVITSDGKDTRDRHNTDTNWWGGKIPAAAAVNTANQTLL